MKNQVNLFVAIDELDFSEMPGGLDLLLDTNSCVSTTPEWPVNAHYLLDCTTLEIKPQGIVYAQGFKPTEEEKALYNSLELSAHGPKNLDGKILMGVKLHACWHALEILDYWFYECRLGQTLVNPSPAIECL
jgi:hypothetical protein